MKYWRKRRRRDGVESAPLTPTQVQSLRDSEDRMGKRIVRLILVLAFAVGIAHAALFMSVGARQYWVIVLVSVINSLLLVLAYFIVVRGHELQGVVFANVVCSTHLLWVCSQFSSDVSAESILFPIALSPFVLARRDLPALRIAVSSFSIGIYVICELVFPAGKGAHALPADIAVAFATANRLTAGLILLAIIVIIQVNMSSTRRILEGAARYGELRATTDELTGLYNRRPVIAQLSQWAQRGRGNYAIALIDLDHFKSINDESGHECGDRILESVALTLREHFRETDLVSRWGGDEFLVLMPGVRHADLEPKLERLRRAINLIEARCGGHAHQLSVSIGAAMGAIGQTPDQCIAAADHALYRAKDQGRNQVVAIGGSEPTQARGRPTPDELASPPAGPAEHL
jgi:diguanylate cyclase (GGDEF)-like protein